MIKAGVTVGRHDDQVGLELFGDLGDYVVWNSEVNLGAAFTVPPPRPLLQLGKFFGCLHAMVLQDFRNVGHQAGIPDGLDHMKQQQFGVARLCEVNRVVERF